MGSSNTVGTAKAVETITASRTKQFMGFYGVSSRWSGNFEGDLNPGRQEEIYGEM
jgi:hypothetical protein